MDKLITNNLPVLKLDFTKKTYLYLGFVFLLFNYFLYKKKYYILILFIVLGIIAYLLLKENNRLHVNEAVDFENLEDKMQVLLNNKMVKKNFLYVDLELLEFLYSIRAFRRKSLKYFNDTLRSINEFLEVYEYIIENNKATSENLQRLSDLKKKALNNFHSILFRITELLEIQKHNEVRYILEEKLNYLFLECLDLSRGHINLSNFGHDKYFDKYYDIY